MDRRGSRDRLRRAGGRRLRQRRRRRQAEGLPRLRHGRNGAWVWGKLGYLPTGNAGAFPAESPSDKLVDLVYALKAGYRQNASFVMNRKTQAAIRKFKDADGNYLWQPPASAGRRRR